jgi:predicted ATP-dependent endonuclease of OLD family
MKISSLKIENFRLLESVEVNLEEITTAIVGKNNSGKTSFSEILNIFMNRKSKKFEFEDFSIKSYKNFEHAYKIFKEINDENKDEKEKELRNNTPKIKLILNIEYSKDNWSNLEPFLISSDDESNEIKILFEYTPKDTKKFFQTLKDNKERNNSELIDEIRNILTDNYKMVIKSLSAEENEEINFSNVEKLLQCHFIEAQRDLENDNKPNHTMLSSIFQTEYDYKRNKKNDDDLKGLIKSTNKANDEIEQKLNIFFKTFIDSFKTFGFLGIDNEKLELQSIIAIENLFKNNVRLVYKHIFNEIKNILPEKYNGLGYKNLMYIIAKIKSFEAQHQDKQSDLNLLFIEEPEAHMHPQMQTVFIKNITDFLREKKFNVQVVITTHSSHILTNTKFESIRYFLKNEYHSQIKDLKKFTNDNSSKPETLEFLKQYLTLDKGELFFSDKAILFEGVIERLLMPIFINKLDKKEDTDLSKQYISYIEVGGAYINKFKELLEFLEIKTLIITDIDSVEKGESQRYKRCEIKHDDNLITSNPCLKKWLPKKSKILDLLDTEEESKIDKKIRVAYQTKIDSKNLKCGRSFEEAFILDNPQYILDNKDKLSSIKNKLETYTTTDEIIKSSYKIVENIKKTDFAFDLLSNQNNFDTPNYIKEGLIWLSKH